MQDAPIFIDYCSGESFSDKIKTIENKLNKNDEDFSIINNSMNMSITELNKKLDLLLNTNTILLKKIDLLETELQKTKKELHELKETVDKNVFNNSIEIERIVNSSIRQNNNIRFHTTTFLDKFKR